MTGVNGFVGKHLAAEFKAQNCRVIGLGFNEPAHPLIKADLAEYFDCDLNDAAAVAKLPLETVDGVINLAGLAQVGDSFKQPDLYMKVNVGVLDNLGQALLAKKLQVRLVAISTGAVYDSDQAMPLTETSNLVTAGSPYAQSKIAMEKSAAELKKAGLDCVVVRPFNHIGPGQAPGFLVPDLYAKIKQSQANGQPVKVGNLQTKRDYTDVRDVVRAYVSLVLAEKLNFDTYNVCSGQSVAGKTILETLLTAMELTDEIKIQTEESLLRPNDPPDLYGDNSRLKQDTGWQPKIALKQTIKDIVAA